MNRKGFASIVIIIVIVALVVVGGGIFYLQKKKAAPAISQAPVPPPALGTHATTSAAASSSKAANASTPLSTIILNAEPSAGPSPLNVKFTARVPDTNYSITFGDGSTAWITGGPDAQSGGGCVPNQTGLCTITTSHTYIAAASDAKFTAKLERKGAEIFSTTINVRKPMPDTLDSTTWKTYDNGNVSFVYPPSWVMASSSAFARLDMSNVNSPDNKKGILILGIQRSYLPTLQSSINTLLGQSAATSTIDPTKDPYGYFKSFEPSPILREKNVVVDGISGRAFITTTQDTMKETMVLDSVNNVYLISSAPDDTNAYLAKIIASIKLRAR